MNIEESAFKDRKTLAHLNEIDLLNIIEFLQEDRKQWINQFSKTHNESVEIQKENKQLKDNWNKLRKYFNERIEVCDNRLSTPFCNFEKATKERLIFSQCLEKLEELEQGSDK